MVGLNYRIVSPLYSGIRAELDWAMAVPREMAVVIDAVEFAVSMSQFDLDSGEWLEVRRFWPTYEDW